MFRCLSAALLTAATLGWAKPARATIADWRVNEVLASADGDGGIRYIELLVPSGTAGNCLFPTTRIEIYDGNGLLLGAVTPFADTVCYAGGSFFLLASDGAVARFGVGRDATLPLGVPRFAGQICLASSQTTYDCVRWGPVSGAVRFLRNIDDLSSAASMPDGVALARVRDTGVVADDFVLESPTPAAPNAGTIYTGPDAGPPPDARPPPPDAPPPDARTSYARPDAAELARPDANLNPRFLEADPGGGAGCGCGVGGPGRVPWALALLALAAALRARRL
jgi:MYXO-CTERM domain-containing protein